MSLSVIRWFLLGLCECINLRFNGNYGPMKRDVRHILIHQWVVSYSCSSYFSFPFSSYFSSFSFSSTSCCCLFVCLDFNFWLEKKILLPFDLKRIRILHLRGCIKETRNRDYSLFHRQVSMVSWWEGTVRGCQIEMSMYLWYITASVRIVLNYSSWQLGCFVLLTHSTDWEYEALDNDKTEENPTNWDIHFNVIL